MLEGLTVKPVLSLLDHLKDIRAYFLVRHNRRYYTTVPLPPTPLKIYIM